MYIEMKVKLKSKQYSYITIRILQGLSELNSEVHL